MPSLNQPAAILIDLDGTLVDSVPDLAHSVDRMLESLDRSPAGEATVRDWVGNGVERLVKRALTGEMEAEAEPEAELFELALPRFLDLYAKHVMVDSRLYPGVREGLEALLAQGYPLACITNKAERFSQPLLGKLGIADFFQLLVSGDTVATKKPDPAPLHYTAQFFTVPSHRMLMVGDSINDGHAARAAEMAVVCVPYGYNHGRDIHQAQPDAVIDSLDQLPALLNQAA